MTDVARTLFSAKRLVNHFSVISRQMHDAINQMGKAGLTGPTLEGLCEDFDRKYTMEAPSLLEERIEWGKEDCTLFPGKLEERAGVKLRFFVPFDGDPDLFACSDDVHDLERVGGEVVDSERSLVLTYETSDGDLATIRKTFTDDLSKIRGHLEAMKEPLRGFNDSLRESARQRIEARRALLQERDWEKDLGYPMRKDLKGPQPLKGMK